jgi:hypothetical protein
MYQSGSHTPHGAWPGMRAAGLKPAVGVCAQPCTPPIASQRRIQPGVRLAAVGARRARRESGARSRLSSSQCCGVWVPPRSRGTAESRLREYGVEISVCHPARSDRSRVGSVSSVQPARRQPACRPTPSRLERRLPCREPHRQPVSAAQSVSAVQSATQPRVREASSPTHQCHATASRPHIIATPRRQ